MPERATYGNWIAARSPGLFGAGLLGTAVLFATLIAALLTLLATDAGTALGVAVVGLVGFVLTGTPAGAWITRRGLYAHGTLRDEHRSRSGVIDTAKGGPPPDPAARSAREKLTCLTGRRLLVRSRCSNRAVRTPSSRGAGRRGPACRTRGVSIGGWPGMPLC
jgi:hypothetical protein